MYAYCLNNPVNLADSSGSVPWKAILAGVCAAVAVGIVTAVTMGAAAPAAVCTATYMLSTLGIAAEVAGGLATAGAMALTTVATVYAADSAYCYYTGNSLLMHHVYHGNAQAYSNDMMMLSFLTAGYYSMAATGSQMGVCFVAGTLIDAEDGLRPIEEIKAGDYVWAWDEETGEVALKEVVETYINETDELVHVFVDGEEIVATPSHPFYSPVKGWTDAVHLRAGDILVLVNGEYVVVEKVQHELLENPVKVYNFQVEDYHTYYVGSNGVLVHNSCNHGKEWAAKRRAHWKGRASEVGLDSNQGAFTATQQNIERMSKGLAPLDENGVSVVLHHPEGIANNFDYIIEMTRADHIAWHKIHGWSL